MATIHIMVDPDHVVWAAAHPHATCMDTYSNKETIMLFKKTPTLGKYWTKDGKLAIARYLGLPDWMALI